MFIFDITTAVIFFVIFAVVYGILEISDNENFKTIQSKAGLGVVIASVVTAVYGCFMSQGTEKLLTDNFVDAGAKFNTLSGMDNIKAMAEV